MTLEFYDALKILKDGKKIKRKGWHKAGMSIEIQKPDAYSKMTEPYVFMNVNADYRIPWVCSQKDILANDWVIL